MTDTPSTRTKEALAIASFVVATMIAAYCLIVPPHGVIDSSALWAIAQFLVMCCSLLEISATVEKLMRHWHHEKGN